MRILLLAQNYPPVLGGEERHVHDLAVELVCRGHEVAVATMAGGEPRGRTVEEGVRVYRLPSSSQLLERWYRNPGRPQAPPLPDPQLSDALRRVVAAERPDVVHAHNWIVNSYLPLKRASGPPLVLTLHDYGLTCANKRLFRAGAPCPGPSLSRCARCAPATYSVPIAVLAVLGTLATRQLKSKLVDAFVVVSEATAAGNGLGRAGAPYTVIPNFLLDADLERTIGRTPWPALPRGDFMVYAGDLSRDKGIGVLLRAYERLARPSTPLLLIGRRTADVPADLPRGVVLAGPVERSTLLSVFHQSAFALAPSLWWETWGLVALEAMAMGAPVVASRTGGLPEMVIDGQTGLLVDPGDVGGLCAAMARLLDDRVERARLGANAREHARSFAASRIVAQIESLYRSLVEPGVAHESIGSHP